MKDLKDYINAPDTFATTLLTIIIDRYGSECLEWDPLVLALEMQRDFGVAPDTATLDRIQTGATLLTTNMFFQNLESYMHMCNALNLQSIDKNNLTPADVDDCAWGVTEAMLLLGKDFKEMQWNPNVALYTGTMLQQEGILRPPSVLGFAIYPNQPLEEGVDETKDPILFQTAWSVQDDRKREIEERLQERIQVLFKQLKELPLRSLNRKLFEEPG
jgi:hypothetical protein